MTFSWYACHFLQGLFWAAWPLPSFTVLAETPVQMPLTHASLGVLHEPLIPLQQITEVPLTPASLQTVSQEIILTWHMTIIAQDANGKKCLITCCCQVPMTSYIIWLILSPGWHSPLTLRHTHFQIASLLHPSVFQCTVPLPH